MGNTPPNTAPGTILKIDTLGLVLTIGQNAEPDIAGQNVWYRITQRDVAIVAIRYRCDEGSPHVIIRTDFSFGRNEQDKVHYEIGGFNYTPPSETRLPAGISVIPRRLRIDPKLMKSFIAEGLVSPENVSQYQQHLHWTDSVYFKTHKKHILELAAQV